MYLSIFLLIILISTHLNLDEIFAQPIQDENKYNSIIIDEQIIKSDLDEIALNSALDVIGKSSKIKNVFVGTFDSDSTKMNFYSEIDKEGKWIDNLLNSLENNSNKTSSMDVLFGIISLIVSPFLTK